MNKKSRGTMKVDFETVCPCGQSVTVGTATYEGHEDEPTVLHALPECDSFIKLDVISYLRFLRNAKDN